MQRTLLFLKPDAIHRGLIGPVLNRLERRGMKLVGMKLMRVDNDLAQRHYVEHKGKPFYNGLISFVTSAPIVAMVWEGENAVAITRETMGHTDPAKASPGTIRADFGIDLGRNIIHGSDSSESAEREINLFFHPDELFDYVRSNDKWITE